MPSPLMLAQNGELCFTDRNVHAYLGIDGTTIEFDIKKSEPFVFLSRQKIPLNETLMIKIFCRHGLVYVFSSKSFFWREMSCT